MLGVKWNTCEDQLGYTFDAITRVAEIAEPTKRGIVSVIGRFYDPIGFPAPIVIKFKMYMQALSEAKIGWDELLPELLMLRWQTIVSDHELRRAKAIAIPRSYLSGIEEEVLAYKLCGYCDALLTAYAAMIYLLIETESESYSHAFCGIEDQSHTTQETKYSSVGTPFSTPTAQADII